MGQSGAGLEEIAGVAGFGLGLDSEQRRLGQSKGQLLNGEPSLSAISYSHCTCKCQDRIAISEVLGSSNLSNLAGFQPCKGHSLYQGKRVSFSARPWVEVTSA